MSLKNKLTTTTNTNYFKSDFKEVLESNLINLRQIHSKPVTVSPELRIRFDFDFYGLLNALGIDVEYHWINMRLNGFTNPNEYIKTTEVILLATESSVDDILSTHLTTYR